MNLISALNPVLPARIAIVGAGGKTTALFQLARQIDGLAWVTTTTHLGTDQMGLADRHFVVQDDDEFLTDLLKQQKVTLITGPFTLDNRVRSLAPEQLELMRHHADGEKISILIEADGSRSIPLKAPGEHEPPIPAWVTHAIVVVGLSVLGKPFTPQWVYRPELFAQLTGLEEGAPVTIDTISGMLVQPQGGLKNMPLQAQKVALFNQADSAEIQALAKSVVPKLLDGGFDKIIIGSLGKAETMLECFSRT